MALNNDILAGYQGYDPSFQPMQSRVTMPMQQAGGTASQLGQGLMGAGGASAALPWVSAGLSGAGLLSSIYGQYKAQQQAEDNYALQMKEFERQKRIEDDQRQRQIAQQALENSYSAKNSVQGDEANRMAKYSNYYKQIGLA